VRWLLVKISRAFFKPNQSVRRRDHADQKAGADNSRCAEKYVFAICLGRQVCRRSSEFGPLLASRAARPKNRDGRDFYVLTRPNRSRPAQVWELAIKIGPRKLPLPLPYRTWVEEVIVNLGAELIPMCAAAFAASMPTAVTNSGARLSPRRISTAEAA